MGGEHPRQPEGRAPTFGVMAPSTGIWPGCEFAWGADAGRPPIVRRIQELAMTPTPIRTDTSATTGTLDAAPAAHEPDTPAAASGGAVEASMLPRFVALL